MQHGTIGMYRHARCRCYSCRTAWNEKAKQWKFAKRVKRKKQLDAIFNL